MTSFSDTGRPPGTYSYTVKATDAAGNLSDASDTASATVPDSSDPTAPTGLGATAVELHPGRPELAGVHATTSA